MITRLQTILIHTALRDIRRQNPAYDDAAYRTTLRSLAGVSSSQELSQSGFEQIMAFFESVGWTDSNHGSGYWSRKASQVSNGQITDRQRRMIESLAQQYGELHLPGFILRMTNHRTSDVNDLRNWEAHNVIEGLKKMVERGASVPTGSVRPSREPRPYSPTAQELAQIQQDQLPL